MFAKAEKKIAMSGKAEKENCNVWKSQNQEFQCLENPKYRIPMFEKSKNPEFQYLEKLKSRIPMFGKAKI